MDLCPSWRRKCRYACLKCCEFFPEIDHGKMKEKTIHMTLCKSDVRSRLKFEKYIVNIFIHMCIFKLFIRLLVKYNLPTMA